MCDPKQDLKQHMEGGDYEGRMENSAWFHHRSCRLRTLRRVTIDFFMPFVSLSAVNHLSPTSLSLILSATSVAL